MSEIARLIIEQGRAAAAAREASGAAWGQAVTNIGALPGQALAAHQQQVDRQQAQAIAQSREARESAAAAQEQQVRGLQINAATRAAQDQTALDTIWGSGIIKEDGSIDKEKAQQLAVKAGMPHLVPAIIDQANKWDASTADLNAKKDAAKKSAMELQTAQQDQLGVDAADLRRGTPDPGTFSLWIAKRAKDGIIPPDEANAAIEAAHQDPAAIGSYLDRKIQGSKSAQAQRTAGLKEVPKEGTLVDVNAIDPATGKPRVVASGAPADKHYEQKPVLLDGKPAEVRFDPATGRSELPDGTDVSARVKPIPAASLTIRNENAKGLDLPTWAIDDKRPTGNEANRLDPTIRMTPNGLYQAAQNYIVNGQFPPTGRGSDPVAVAQRAAITSKVGALASASGMDEPALRAFFKSNASSLTQQQKMQDSVQGFMATADKNADLLDAALKKIPDIGIPIFNKPLRAFEKDVAGDANLSQFGTYLKSVQNEYARIISQPNLAGQLTDSARKEAEQLIDPKATVPQILSSIQALRAEGTNRLVSVGEQIKRIQGRMGGAPPAAASAPASAADPLGIRRVMADQSLVELVRTKYPGAYDDLSDFALDTQVRAKYPGVYDDLAKPTANFKTTNEPPSTALKAAAYGKDAMSLALDALPGAGAVIGGVIATPETAGAGTLAGAAFGAGAGRGLRDIIKAGLGLEKPATAMQEGGRIALDAGETYLAGKVLPALWEAIKKPGATVADVYDGVRQLNNAMPKLLKFNLPKLPPGVGKAPATVLEGRAAQSWDQFIKDSAYENKTMADVTGATPAPVTQAPPAEPIAAPTPASPAAATPQVATAPAAVPLKMSDRLNLFMRTARQAGVTLSGDDYLALNKAVTAGADPAQAVQSLIEARNPAAALAKMPGMMSDADVRAALDARNMRGQSKTPSAETARARRNP